MTKQEFEELYGKEVGKTQYDVIEEVYTFHPIIKNVGGKEQIATLYKMGGMRLMYDMLPTAREAKRFENELSITRSKLAELQANYDELKRGY